MKIKIVNNFAEGLICFNAVEINKKLLFAFARKLYNFVYDVWYDFGRNVFLIKMYGSIISMMQFRKFILINWPDALLK